MSLLKIKRISVLTPKGERILSFMPIDEHLLNEQEYTPCDKQCPYGPELCDKIKDPRDPTNPKKCFGDWCANLGNNEGDQPEYANCVPIEGTIEENLGDIQDIHQTLIEKDPLVKLTNVIDNVCDGYCDMYEQTHSQCNSNNKLCILRKLFKNNKND